MAAPSNYPRPAPQGFNGLQCPSCQQTAGKPVSYTWWGGVIGPALFSLTKCQACGYQYNRKTGKPTRNAVITYNVVVGVITLLVVIAILVGRGAS